ncbi:MAG: OmpA family protein, partial [Chryseolinea sp.]
MRFLLLCLLIFGMVLGGKAQDDRAVRSLKAEADRYYADEQYNLAIQDYRELADQNIKDAGVGFKLAECYRKTFNYAEAETYYLKVYYLSPKEYPLSLYYFALMLKFNGNFDEAIQYFSEFISLHQAKRDVKDYVEQAIIDRSGCEAAKDDMNSDNRIYPRFYPKLNTTFNDFAPAVRDSINLVISSGRVLSNRQSIDERFGEAFTDNFYFEKQGNNWVDKTKQLFSITNTKYNDGSGSFNKRGDKYYYTVCGEEGPQCRIFFTEFKNKKWTTPVALNTNINLQEFEARQPAISHGGDSLVFASNRPGGSGGFDLWISVNAGGENWGPPMNMGASINTKLNELAPAFTSFPNILFFASDGHEGFGGLDLYMSKRMSTGEINLYNLGSPFNSNRDDCFLSFSERELYWSSNRNEGLGGFDILAVKIPSVPAFISRMSLKKGNARRDIRLQQKTEETQKTDIQASRLEERIDYDRLTYEKQKIVDKIIEDRTANKVVTAAQYNVTAPEFATLSRIAEQKIKSDQNKKSYLSRIVSPAGGNEEILVTGILKDSLSGNALVSHNVLLTDKNGEVIKITSTNSEGKFRFSGITQGEFFIRLERNIDLGDVSPMISNLSVTKQQEQVTVQVENIYFDFDHYRLRPESQKVLDELAAYLKANTGAQIEIFAFADDRGTNEYNLKLTQKRGQSVVDYLRKKGVDQTGLAITAKGKQAPREVDVELQRQYDRRVEFYLNGTSGSYKEFAKTYILKKQVDWATLSKLTGISVNDLKNLNGITEDKLKIFQPVRLPA